MSIIRNNAFLWTLQVVLAALFVFAGLAKLTAPPAELAAQSNMSVAFLRFVSVCELLGAIGLVVPRLTGILPVLTPVAAGCLIVIMIGALTTSLMQGQPLLLLVLPCVTGVLLTIVAYGRTRRAIAYPLAPSGR